MNSIQVFNSPDFGEVRTIEIDGKTFFNASDVASALGYNNPRKAIIDHCKGVTKCDTPTTSGIQAVNYIPESDIYRLIVRSHLPSADKFEHWIFDEVLPTIRKTGSYSVIDRQALSPQTKALYGLIESIAEMEIRQNKQAEQINDIESRVDNMKEIMVEPLGDWKNDINKRVREIAQKAFNSNYEKTWAELYGELETSGRTVLSRLCENKKKRMEAAGNTKTAIANATTRLAVIYDNQRLRVIFEGIVKRYAMAYCT